MTRPQADDRFLVRHGATLALVAIVLGYLALSVWLADRCLDDDAFISFRYARNFLRGHGLVYNPGERVEGYTNFLWTMLCAAAMAAGAEPDIAAQVLGMLCGAGTLIVMYQLARQAELPSWWALAAPAALAATLPFAVENLLGLEMPLYVFLSLLALSTTSVAAGVVFALLAMTRPEGLALFALAHLLELRRPWPWRNWLARGGAFLCLYGPYWIWRFTYYGQPFPNTFYAKTGGGAWIWQLGLEYVGGALLRTGPLVLVALPLALGARWRQLPRYALLCAVWCAFMPVYLASVGGDFRFHYRFFVPLLPWLFLLAAAAAAQLRQRAWVLACAATFVWPIVGFREPALRWVHYREVRNPQLFAVGRFLQAVAPPDSLLAISGGGIIPWQSDLPAIEMWGLTDVTIARAAPRRMGHGLAGHLKGDGAYILSRRPRYIQFIALIWTRRPAQLDEVASRIAAPSEMDLWRSPEFHEKYRLRAYQLDEHGFVNLFERVDAPDSGTAPRTR
jgi:arabinofuranosyltransferase